MSSSIQVGESTELEEILPGGTGLILVSLWLPCQDVFPISATPFFIHRLYTETGEEPSLAMCFRDITA